MFETTWQNNLFSEVKYISQRTSYAILQVFWILFLQKNISHICRYYRKNPIKSETRKACSNHPKIRTRWLYRRVIMHLKDAGGMANSVDPDQTLSAWSGSTLFAQICLSENIGLLRYFAGGISLNWSFSLKYITLSHLHMSKVMSEVSPKNCALPHFKGLNKDVCILNVFCFTHLMQISIYRHVKAWFKENQRDFGKNQCQLKFYIKYMGKFHKLFSVSTRKEPNFAEIYVRCIL